MKFSVVIISYNEAAQIAGCIESVQHLTDDILVIDAGSTDGTQDIAGLMGARCLHKPWTNYAEARNYGARHAMYDWIFNLDCDERVVLQSPDRIDILVGSRPSVYGFNRLNRSGNHVFRFGCLGREKVWRLYNRFDTSWSIVPVHETLLQGKRKLYEAVQVIHDAIPDWSSYKAKRMHYALLCARKYFQAGKRASAVLPIFAAIFYFLKDYVFFMGFLDGIPGWKVAIINSHYTYHKYAILYQLQHETRNSMVTMPNLSES